MLAVLLDNDLYFELSQTSKHFLLNLGTDIMLSTPLSVK